MFLTLDVDWAPDWMIEEVAEILIENKVKATWFATHRSQVIDWLEKEDLFEVGIHPNFCRNSTHGTTEDEVLKYIRELFPEAISMRAHGLYSNTKLLHKCAKLGIKVDVSIFVDRGEKLKPFKIYFEDGLFMIRAPFLWEDDFEMNKPNPYWDFSDILEIEGIKIFNFHPVHICLNSPNLKFYSTVKKEIYSSEKKIPPIQGIGPRNAFFSLLSTMENFRFIRELL